MHISHFNQRNQEKSNIISYIWGIRKKIRKKGAQKKGGGWKFTRFTSPGSAPVQYINFYFNTMVIRALPLKEGVVHLS